ncbi:semaphorin-7A [Chanos chanos]|uniref:Semaphorin-7A n=1 Tax=Chanos chanos TaxID=29144 RepID=A0A6J2URV5_CHACN|nr:semaphorin-7A [Chanos chanos]
MGFLWQVSLYVTYNFLVVCCDAIDPRLNLYQDVRLTYNRTFYHTVFFHEEGSDSLFVGGPNFVIQIDLNQREIVEHINLTSTERSCSESPCENVITAIEQFQDCLFVCGTNGENPQCWRLYPEGKNYNTEPVKSFEGTGISPPKYWQNSISLTADGDLYAAAPLYKDGTSLQFRRQTGRRSSMWMYDKWVTNPTFISAFLAKRTEDPENEKIYVLFREKNPDSSPEADPWISRVARVCKVDEGGSKRLFQNVWTSFLKARLVCGIPGESLYFNRLQDVYVQHGKNWKESRVYALFTSSWNSTAVCIYSLGDLDKVFENSSFKGYNHEIPHPRPGTCVENSKALPISTISIIRDHPEMTDWIQPIHKETPFYTSNNNYTRIVVDRVQTADKHMYNVIYLTTDSGKIHKILENKTEAFIISETQLSEDRAPVQSMTLDSKKRKLFVGFSEQLSMMDLHRCQDYNTSCETCVLSRDPYCAWAENGCTHEIQGGIQNIATGETSICRKVSGSTRRKRDTLSPSPEPRRAKHSVPLGFPFYLTCPMDSHHASYIWKHNEQSSPCQQSGSNCLHLIPAVAETDYGSYECVSMERDYTRVVREYQVERQVEARSSPYSYSQSNVSGLRVQRTWVIVAVVALLIVL